MQTFWHLNCDCNKPRQPHKAIITDSNSVVVTKCYLMRIQWRKALQATVYPWVSSCPTVCKEHSCLPQSVAESWHQPNPLFGKRRTLVNLWINQDVLTAINPPPVGIDACAVLGMCLVVGTSSSIVMIIWSVFPPVIQRLWGRTAKEGNHYPMESLHLR